MQRLFADAHIAAGSSRSAALAYVQAMMAICIFGMSVTRLYARTRVDGEHKPVHGMWWSSVASMRATKFPKSTLL
jgi:hypothetical protein